MALAYKRLKEISYITSGVDQLLANAAGKVVFVRSILLHNTDINPINVYLYLVPDNGGAVGTVGNDKRFYQENLPAGALRMLEFPAPGIMLVDTNDSIQASVDTGDKITVQIYGGEDDV